MTAEAVRVVEQYERALRLLWNWEYEVRERRTKLRRAERRVEQLRREVAALAPRHEVLRHEVFICDEVETVSP